GADPGVDPERLDADDLLLFIAHRAGDVHHVDDHRVRHRLRLHLPGARARVVGRRGGQRARRVVRACGGLAAQRLLVRPREGAQALRPGALDAAVAVARHGERLGSLGLDTWQLQLFAHQLGELLDGELDLADVVARRIARLAGAIHVAVGAERRAGFAGPLADAAQVTTAVTEAGQLDLRHGDRDQFLALPPDELAAGDVPLEVLLDLAADDLLEPPAIALDTPDHTASTTVPASTVTPAMVAARRPARRRPGPGQGLAPPPRGPGRGRRLARPASSVARGSARRSRAVARGTGPGQGGRPPLGPEGRKWRLSAATCGPPSHRLARRCSRRSSARPSRTRRSSRTG